MRHKKGFVTVLILAVLVGAGLSPARGRTTGAQDPPGPLSSAHSSKPGDAACAACHAAPAKVTPAKCLACHGEIASRIAAGTGYHRDKAEDCAICHAEHQGRGESIVPLDPASFDHSETGAVLEGAHLRTNDCAVCHTPAYSFPRTQGRSYLLKAPGCRGCHRPPHPGREENCLACHGQETWTVDHRRAKG